MHPLVKAMMKSKMGYAKGGLVKEEHKDGVSSEALELAKAIMAKTRPVAQDSDELFDDEFQSPLPGGEMPSDPYREIEGEGEGEEREAMKKKGLIQLALEKARKNS
jgi:hypothetical protein